MKRTLIDKIPTVLPDSINRYARNAVLYDSSSSPMARVYYIEKDGGFFLKVAEAGALEREAQLTAYLHSLGKGAEVIEYVTGECDLLLTARVVGEDCTHPDYLSDPKRLCDTLAYQLRELHETDGTECPVKHRTEEYLATAEKNYKTGNYDTSHFPDSFGYRSAEEAWQTLLEGKNALKCDTLLHGDYCLPNVILDGWRLSGFIDVGCGGIGDRHIDLFWGAWSLWFNLKTDFYRERFFDAYGRDAFDKDLLKIIAAAEVFG